jgi:hypothetical protein
MAGTVPEYIGYPHDQVNNAGGEKNVFEEHMKDKIVYAEIRPKLKTVSGDANIYTGIDALGQYKGDLSDMGISFPHHLLKVVLCRQVPVQEVYHNEYGASEILPTSNLLGGGAISELADIAGVHDTNDVQKILQNTNGLGGSIGHKIAKGYNNTVDNLQKMALALSENQDGFSQAGSKMLNAAHSIAKSPWSKINWPQVWRNCNYTSSYSLTTRLYCYHCQTKEDYDNNIRAALAALQLFTAPKSKDGILYTAPYVMDFKIPGLLHMPLAYCDNLSVIKGGEEGDFASDGRPNIIEVSMSIQNAYSLCVNTPPSSCYKNPDRPAVFWDHTILGEPKTLANKEAGSIYNQKGSARTQVQQAIAQSAVQQSSQRSAPSEKSQAAAKALE